MNDDFDYTQFRIASGKYNNLLAETLTTTQQDIARLLVDIRFLCHLKHRRNVLMAEGAENLPEVKMEYAGNDEVVKRLIEVVEALTSDNVQ